MNGDGKREATGRSGRDGVTTRYETGVPIGRGGMGEVVKAFDPVLKRFVALKILRRDDPELTERLLAEARAQASVDHPNVAKVYEVGTLEDGRAFIAMQLIEGRTLDAVAEKCSVEQKVRLIRTVADAVQAAHARGLIHRDIKPGNILVVEDADEGLTPFVLDFGIAREHEVEGLTRTGQIIGTPGYMAPEQARGEVRRLDRRADVYSLGVVLYELLGGQLPHTGASSVEVLIKVMQEEPRALRKIASHVPTDLDTVTMKCLEKDPGRRYPSARALADDLDRYLAGEPIQARRTSLAYRLRMRLRKHRALAAAAAAAAVILVAAGTVTITTRSRAGERARLAEQFGQRLERIDALMRFAHLAPPHDITPDVRAVRELLAGIVTEVDRRGPIAAGVGNYAMARGHVALGELGEARGHIDRAWAAGWRGAEASVLAARIYAGLFREESGRIEAIRDPDRRAAERLAVETNFRDPALRFLATAQLQGARTAPYVEAMMASIRGDRAAALDRAAEAAGVEPWFYEPLLLAADVHLASASEHFWKSAYEASQRAVEEARIALDRAATVGRSDPAVGIAQCRAWLARCDIDCATGKAPDASLAAVRTSCSAALAIDPGCVQGHELIARSALAVAEFKRRRGQDPEAEVSLALAESASILSVKADAVEGLLASGTAHMIRGEWLDDGGQDPTRAIDDALALLSRAVAGNPGNAEALTLLGNAHATRGIAAQKRDRDPFADFERAVAAFDRALALPGGRTARISSNLGVVLTETAFELRRRGRDPLPTLDRSVSVLNEARRLSPAYLSPAVALGLSLWTRGEISADTGGSADPWLAEAEAVLNEVLAADPSRAAAAANLSGVYSTRARLELGKGRDPGRWLTLSQAANASLRDVLDWDFVFNETEQHLLRARWAMVAGKDAVPALAEAEAMARRMLASYPDEADGLRFLAEVHRRRAEWLRRSDRPAAVRRSEIERGLTAAREALRRSPRSGAAAAHQAALEYEAALLTAGRAQQAVRMDAARRALAHALAVEPGLVDDIITVIGGPGAGGEAPAGRP